MRRVGFRRQMPHGHVAKWSHPFLLLKEDAHSRNPEQRHMFLQNLVDQVEVLVPILGIQSK